MLVVATVLVQALVGALLIITYADTGTTARNLTNFQQCMVDYNQKFSQAYKVRSDNYQATQDPMEKLLKAVRNKDNKAFQAALDRYLAVRKRQARERESHPLPPLPEQFCGSVPGEQG